MVQRGTRQLLGHDEVVASDDCERAEERKDNGDAADSRHGGADGRRQGESPASATTTVSTPTPYARAPRIRFKLGNPIGRGAGGTVYLALNEETGALMAAKAVDITTSRVNVHALANELRLLR